MTHEYSEQRIEALKRGRVQWGCDGSTLVRHHDRDLESPLCVLIEAGRIYDRVHFHDAFCASPGKLECALAGVEWREEWSSRA